MVYSMINSIAMFAGPVFWAILALACPCFIILFIIKTLQSRPQQSNTPLTTPPPLPATSEPIFQISRSGKIIGSYPQSQIASYLEVSSGHVLPTDYYWTVGMGTWLKVSEKTDWEVAAAKAADEPILTTASKNPAPMTGVVSINGTVLSFTIQESTGLITGDDSIRYSFVAKSWKAGVAPAPGIRVAFIPQNNEAFDIFPHAQAVGGKFCRSTNKKVIGGVCAGLAAHWKMDTTMVRVVVAAVTLFGSMVIFGLVVPVIYLGLWIFTPEGSTE